MGESLGFSPDSSHVAYAIQRDKQWFVVLDGKESKPYDGIGAILSPQKRYDSILLHRFLHLARTASLVELL